MTIGNLKLKLFSLIGTSPPNMRLTLQAGDGLENVTPDLLIDW